MDKALNKLVEVALHAAITVGKSRNEARVPPLPAAPVLLFRGVNPNMINTPFLLVDEK